MNAFKGNLFYKYVFDVVEAAGNGWDCDDALKAK